MEYLNRGVPTLGICIYRRRVIQEAPRWWLLHTQAHRRFLSLSPPTDQASGLCCASRSGKKSPCKKKKKTKNPLWRSPPGWVHQDARPRVPMATSCPHSLLCLTEGLKLFTDSGHKQLKVQQGYESNRDGALSLSITAQWRRGWSLRSWAGKAQGLRETRQYPVCIRILAGTHSCRLRLACDWP